MLSLVLILLLIYADIYESVLVSMLKLQEGSPHLHLKIVFHLKWHLFIRVMNLSFLVL